MSNYSYPSVQVVVQSFAISRFRVTFVGSNSELFSDRDDCRC